MCVGRRRVLSVSRNGRAIDGWMDGWMGKAKAKATDEVDYGIAAVMYCIGEARACGWTKQIKLLYRFCF
jgi:hypothetical protein